MYSRRGICYDLSMSSYKFTINNLTFVFSSKLHRNKFKQKYIENRISINSSLTQRFKYNIDVGILCDLILYKKIETRGFMVTTASGETLCQNNIIFGGLEVITQD